MNHIYLDGRLTEAGEPVLAVSNKSYRYGDGIFETVKVFRKKILLEELHFQRFFSGLNILGFDVPALFTIDRLRQYILHLCEKNRCSELARVRLTAFRGNGGLYEGDNTLHYTIECWPLSAAVNQLNENGLEIDIYPLARKSCDIFSNLKSANFLHYVMAARYARENKLNDCLVLNVHERIADATIANLFIIKNNQVFTPPLTEGCVAGTMRQHLLQELKADEKPIAVADLLQADEVFLTNAISGIRWVKQFREKVYTGEQTAKIYRQLIKTFFD